MKIFHLKEHFKQIKTASNLTREKQEKDSGFFEDILNASNGKHITFC